MTISQIQMRATNQLDCKELRTFPIKNKKNPKIVSWFSSQST